MTDINALRLAEALIFASATPIPLGVIAAQLPEGCPAIEDLVLDLSAHYAGRGVVLVRVGGGVMFRTAPDLARFFTESSIETRKLTRPSLETLSIIAYHQPVTRAEIEEIRGVATSRGTLDILLQTSWIRMRGRRRTPGRPVTYGTTKDFLTYFGLHTLADLPGIDELQGAGFIEGRLPAGFTVPVPNDMPALLPEEDALEEDVFDAMIDERANTPDAPLNPEATS